MRKPQEGDIRRAEQVARRFAARQMRGQAWEGIDVEDVVQEVLLRFSQLDLDEISNFEAWVTTATRNRCADVRGAAERHDLARVGAGAHPDVVAVDDREIFLRVVGPSAAAISPMVLSHALQGLSEQERQLLLRHADGWSNAELADQFGYASAQSAAVALTRAKNKVRERFNSASQRRDLIDHPRAY